MLRKFIYGLCLVVLLVIAGGYWYLHNKLPQRSGEIVLPGLKHKVQVFSMNGQFPTSKRKMSMMHTWP